MTERDALVSAAPDSKMSRPLTRAEPYHLARITVVAPAPSMVGLR